MSAYPSYALRLSFDIDVTLESGCLPGAATPAHLLRQCQMGHLIRSASDRMVRDQQQIWREIGLEPDFGVLKHQLAEVRVLFLAADGYWHIGDGYLDRYYAEAAGFAYMEQGEFATSFGVR